MLIPAYVKIGSCLFFGCVSISYWVCILHVSFVMVCLKRWGPGLVMVGCTLCLGKGKGKETKESSNVHSIEWQSLLSTHFTLYCIITFTLFTGLCWVFSLSGWD